MSGTTAEKKRQQLREKVAAGEARHEARQAQTLAEKAEEARDKALDFVQEHPLLTVAGGVALGIAISALFPKSPTRKAARRGGDLLRIAAELGVAYGLRALEAAEEAGVAGYDKLQDFGDAAGDQARKLRREAGYQAGNAGDAARTLARKAQRSTTRGVRDLKSRLDRN